MKVNFRTKTPNGVVKLERVMALQIWTKGGRVRGIALSDHEANVRFDVPKSMKLTIEEAPLRVLEGNDYD